MKRRFLLILLLLFSFNVFADALEGLWLTGDKDPIKRLKVRIVKKGDNYYGTIVDKYHPDTPDVCIMCKGAYKDKDLHGVQIIKQLTKDNKNPNRYNGKLYNPEDDGTYSGYFELIEGGSKLKAVGKWWIFSRRQTWIRLE